MSAKIPKQPQSKIPRQTRSITTKINKDKMTQEESARKGGDEMGALATALGKLIVQVQEESRKDREKDREDSNKQLMLLTDKLENIQLAQIKNNESQKLSIKTPLPKYGGKPGEFHDWKLAVLNCIKLNDWRDEKRILEMLPSALTGQAARVYVSLSTTQKLTLDSAFQALKDSLEPEGKAMNRELFIKAKRNPGESMRSFVSRLGQYVSRADEIDDIAESQWANPFIIEKIYTNLGPHDRKILKCTSGKEEDIQLLCSKADELILMNEGMVGAIGLEPQNRRWQSQSPISKQNRYDVPFRMGCGKKGRKPTRWQGQGWQPNQQWQVSRGQWECWNDTHHANTQTFRPGGENEPKSYNITEEPTQRASAQAIQPAIQENSLNRSPIRKVIGDSAQNNPFTTCFEDDKWIGNVHLPQYLNTSYDETEEVPSLGYIIGHANMISFPMCIDTGATRSLISSDLWKRLNAKNRCELKPEMRGFQAVNGSKINCHGSAIIQLMLMGEKMNYVGYFHFHVVDNLSIEALMGMDGIFRHGLRINTNEGFAKQDKVGRLIANLSYRTPYNVGMILADKTSKHLDPGEPLLYK